METLDDILDSLNSLLRTGARLAGYDWHNCRLSAPLPERKVRAFEVEHGISLPSEYRAFLIQAGRGGVGPGYGLFNFQEMDHCEEHRRWTPGDGVVGLLAEPFPHTEEWNDLSGRPPDELLDTDEDGYWELLSAWEERYWGPLNGAIPICHRGCNLWDWLVVAGPEASNVWVDSRADYWGLAPVKTVNKRRMSFFAWYQDWIDETMAAQNFKWGAIERCRQCGAGNPEGTANCIRCGVRLRDGN